MREANKLGAAKVLMIGGEEYERGKAVLKNMTDGDQKEVDLNSLEL